MADNLLENTPEMNFSSKDTDEVKCEDKSWLDFKSLPIDIILNKINSKIKLGKPSVKCIDLDCKISLPVKQIYVSTDLLVQKCVDQEVFFGINKLGLELSNNSEEIQFNINLAIEKDENDKGQIVIKNKSSISQIPKRSLSVLIEGENNIDELNQKLSLIVNSIIENKELLKNDQIEYSWFIDQAKAFVNLKKNDDSLNVGPNDVNKFVQQAIDTRYFSNKKSKVVFKALQGAISADNLEWINTKLYKILNDSLSELVATQVEKQMESKKLLSTEFDFEIPGVSIESITDSSTITKRYKIVKSGLQRCQNIKMYWGTCTFRNIKEFFIMAKYSDLESVLEMAFDIQQELIQLEKSKKTLESTDILDEESYVYTMKNFNIYNEKYMPYLIKKIKRNILGISKSEQKMSLFNLIKKEDSVEFVFSINSKNKNDSLKFEGLSSGSIPSIENREYDLALAVNIESINSMLKWQVKRKYFDFCMNSSQFTTCQNKGFFDTITNLKFNHAPQIKRIEDHYVFSIDKTEADFEFMGLPTNWFGTRAIVSASVPFNFVLLDQGRKLSFESAGDVTADYDFFEMSLKSVIPKLLSLVHAPLVSVVMGLGANIAQTSLTKGFDLIGEESFIEEIVEIKPHPENKNELLVYLKIGSSLSKIKKEELLENQLKEEI